MGAGVGRDGVGGSGVGLVGSGGVGVVSSTMDASNVIVTVGSCSGGPGMSCGCRLASSVGPCSSVTEGASSWSG